MTSNLKRFALLIFYLKKEPQTITSLGNTLGCADTTIRRQLRALESLELVRRIEKPVPQPAIWEWVQ